MSLATDKITLVYIMGTARSGSTILDMALGSNPGVFSSGELHSFPTFGTAERTCACGADSSTCPVWSEVAKDYRAKFGPRGLSDLAEQGRFYVRLRNLPAAMWQHWARSPRLEAYLDRIEYLIRSIHRHTGRRIITDSSKEVSLAWIYRYLAREDFDVKILHSIRDFWHVRESFLRHPEGGFFDSSAPPPRGEYLATPLRAFLPVRERDISATWLYTNLAASLVKRLDSASYRIVRHEDLLRDPVGTLGQVGSFLGVSMTDFAHSVEAGAAFPKGHLFAGNRVRLKEHVTLRARIPELEVSGHTSLLSPIVEVVRRAYGYGPVSTKGRAPRESLPAK